MGQSIFGQFSLLVTLAFALPAMAAGVDLFFVQGNTTWGGALIGIGILMILMEKYVDNPFNAGGLVGEAVVDAAVKEPDEGEDTE
jgi:energy-converting hydrogenase Eha subunit A